MSKFEIIMSVVAFVSSILFFLIVNLSKLKLINSSKKKRKKEVRITEIKYLIYKFNLKEEKLLQKKFIILFSLVNSLIVTAVFMVLMIFPYGIIWQILFGFILLIGLIYSIYGIIGSILLKRGYCK